MWKTSVKTGCFPCCSFFSISAACWLFLGSLCMLFHVLFLSILQFLLKPRQLSFRCFSYLKIEAYCHFLDSHSICTYTWHYVNLGSHLCKGVVIVGFTTWRFHHSRNFCNLRGCWMAKPIYDWIVRWRVCNLQDSYMRTVKILSSTESAGPTALSNLYSLLRVGRTLKWCGAFPLLCSFGAGSFVLPFLSSNMCK